MRLTITLILCAIVSMSGISGTHRLLNDILRRDKTETRKGDISISNRKVSRQLRHSVANNEFIPLMDPTLREDSEWQPERIEAYYDFGSGWELLYTNHYAFNVR